VGKQYHFLAGLHRSGNTVLSAILNQHPDIYSSPLSPVLAYMWNTYVSSKDFQSAKNNMSPERSVRMISKMLENYYEDVDRTFVFDRDKNWAHPANFEMMKECLNFKPKIIFTTRPITEVLASFIAIDGKNIANQMYFSGYNVDSSLSENDNICAYLMQEEMHTGRILKALESIDNADNAGMIHVVKYEDLLNTPQETMDKIYDFLEIESFQHNFKNIRKIEDYDEAAAGLPKDLHKIRRVLGKGDVRVEDYLTPRSIEKYKDLRYF